MKLQLGQGSITRLTDLYPLVPGAYTWTSGGSRTSAVTVMRLPGTANAIGLFDSNFQMRRFHRSGYFLAQAPGRVSQSRYYQRVVPGISRRKTSPRMIPLVSMKKYPGLAMPLNCPTASVFST